MSVAAVSHSSRNRGVIGVRVVAQPGVAVFVEKKRKEKARLQAGRALGLGASKPCGPAVRIYIY